MQEEIVLHTACKISKIDVDEARVTLEDGRRFHGDVLLGADGVHVRPPRSVVGFLLTGLSL